MYLCESTLQEFSTADGDTAMINKDKARVSAKLICQDPVEL